MRLLLGGLEFGYVFQPSSNFMIMPVISTYWASKSANQSYFGIDAEQAQNSIYDQYDAGSGFFGTALEVYFEYQLSKRWVATMSLNYVRLLGDAKKGAHRHWAGRREKSVFR